MNAGNATVRVGVAWIQDRRLTLVDRLVAGDNRGGGVNAALGALVGGPKPSNKGLGSRRWFPRIPSSQRNLPVGGRTSTSTWACLGHQSMAVGELR